MDTFIVGRSPKARVVLSHQTVSSEHLEVTLLDGVVAGDENRLVKLRDLDSTNGSFIYRNGEAVRFSTIHAAYDDVLKLGSEKCFVGQLIHEANFHSSEKIDARAVHTENKPAGISVYIRNSDGSFKRED